LSCARAARPWNRSCGGFPAPLGVFGLGTLLDRVLKDVPKLLDLQDVDLRAKLREQKEVERVTAPARKYRTGTAKRAKSLK
jgi:hypothetical protein